MGTAMLTEGVPVYMGQEKKKRFGHDSQKCHKHMASISLKLFQSFQSQGWLSCPSIPLCEDYSCPLSVNSRPPPIPGSLSGKMLSDFGQVPHTLGRHSGKSPQCLPCSPGCLTLTNSLKSGASSVFCWMRAAPLSWQLQKRM